MNDADLDRSYTALCHALGEVGPERSQLLLAMVALALMARQDDAGEVLALVQRSRDRCLRDGVPANPREGAAVDAGQAGAGRER